MRFLYAREQRVAVPAPVELQRPAPSTPVDPLQELLSRKKEAEKNKLKVKLLLLYLLLY